MPIDLRKDSKAIDKYIQQRVKDYPVYVNAGPGKDEDEISLITLGYQFDQAGWIALVFDTRRNAEFDGTWQSFIAQNAEPFDHWYRAFDDMLENGTRMSVIQIDGKKRTFTTDSDIEEIAECFGALCRDVLERAREKGLFNKLPMANECRLAVEEHDGYFGWVEGPEDEEEIDEDQIIEAMRRDAKRLSKAKAVEYWIDHLQNLAAGKPCQAAKLIWGSEIILESLLSLGDQAIIPLLTWAITWADKPEFKPPEQVQKGEECVYPSASILCDVFVALCESDAIPPAAEALLQEFIRIAIKVKPITNSKRKAATQFQGILPFHAAHVLREHFDGYPEPDKDPKTNLLRNAIQFTDDAKAKRR